jgi:hypothetical protein
VLTNENIRSPIKWRDRDMDEENRDRLKERGNNMNDQTYLMASQIAEMMGPKWSRQRVHTELKRGKFPDPATYVGNQPLWTPQQVKKAMKERGIQE